MATFEPKATIIMAIVGFLRECEPSWVGARSEEHLRRVLALGSSPVKPPPRILLKRGRRDSISPLLIWPSLPVNSTLAHHYGHPGRLEHLRRPLKPFRLERVHSLPCLPRICTARILSTTTAPVLVLIALSLSFLGLSPPSPPLPHIQSTPLNDRSALSLRRQRVATSTASSRL
jgi:hypothetical protein